jgi:hypothetical protein
MGSATTGCGLRSLRDPTEGFKATASSNEPPALFAHRGRTRDSGFDIWVLDANDRDRGIRRHDTVKGTEVFLNLLC